MNKSVSQIPRDTLLDALQGRSVERRIGERPVDHDVAERLRSGQAWLTRKWLQLQDLEEWTEKQEFDFWLNYEKWDRMERQAREAGQIEGCPIGPEGCHEDAPIRCEHCAGEKVVHTPDMPVDVPEPTPEAVETRQGQATMFSLSGRTH